MLCCRLCTLYDETLKTFLQLVGKLDLSTHLSGDADAEDEEEIATGTSGNAQPGAVVKEEERVSVGEAKDGAGDSSDPTTAVVASRPKDIQVLIHLVSFGQELFSSTRTDLFPRWLHIFYSDIVTRSTKVCLRANECV